MKELTVQEQIEGKSDDIELVKKTLEVLKTSHDLSVLLDVRFHRYGVESYKSHRFYYPSKLLKDIMNLAK